MSDEVHTVGRCIQLSEPTKNDVLNEQYRQTFRLAEATQAKEQWPILERIEAKLVDGVLEVLIPKSEQAKPRRIEVKAA